MNPILCCRIIFKTCLSFLLVFKISPLALALPSSDILSFLKSPPSTLSSIQLSGRLLFENYPLNFIYSKNQYKPFWLDESIGRDKLTEARAILQSASEYGLDTDSYWDPALEDYYNRAQNLSELHFEVAVTEAMVRFMTHIFRGRIDPQLVDSDIDRSVVLKPMSQNHWDQMFQIFKGSARDIKLGVSRFEPKIQLYQSLRRYLTQNIDSLDQYQYNKISLTLEKLRWLPSVLGDRFAFVNLAATEMQIFEDSKEIWRMDTVNGRPTRRTPMLIDKVTAIDFNPSWIIPPKLAFWDKLPKIKADSNYLSHNGIDVYRHSLKNLVPDVMSIDWTQVTESFLPYILVQHPSSFNMLGKVKFYLTNSQDIYLHDSNEKGFFDETEPRLHSSGCIRLKEPMEFAAQLLKDQNVPSTSIWRQDDGSFYPANTKFNQDILERMIQQGYNSGEPLRTIRVGLDRTFPLYTAFLTADFDRNGQIRFLNDAYAQDQRLLRILVNTGAAGRPHSISERSDPRERTVPFRIQGQKGPSQFFGEATMIRCAIAPYKGCVDDVRGSNEIREEFKFSMNSTVQVPEGYYLLGFENSRYPGWFHIECKSTIDKTCAPVTLTLNSITVPESLRNNQLVLIYRDLSEPVEQNKIYAEAFHNGNALLKETPIGKYGFYQPGLSQFDVVQRINNEACDKINLGTTSEASPKVISYCVHLKQKNDLSQFLNLDMALQNLNYEGHNDQYDMMKDARAFDFHPPLRESRPLGYWSQKWVIEPGDAMIFNHQQYLVAAPLYPAHVSADQLMVSVLPGSYVVVGINEKGQVSQRIKISTGR